MGMPEVLRPYQSDDYDAVLTLLRHAGRAHVHFDWQSPETFLEGSETELCLGFAAGQLVAAAGVAEPIQATAWLRLLAVDSGQSIGPTVRRLWRCLADRLHSRGVITVHILLQDTWLLRALQPLGAVPVDEVVAMRRDGMVESGHAFHAPQEVAIRPATAADLPGVLRLDAEAFAPMWRLSSRELQAAWRLGDYFVVAEVHGTIAGYAIAMFHAGSGHLARLAIAPAWQGRGIGAKLTQQVLGVFAMRGLTGATVNTQASNASSQKLYLRAGFEFTGYRLPVLALPVA